MSASGIRQDTIDRYHAAKKLVLDGTKVGAARAKIGMGSSTWHRLKMLEQKGQLVATSDNPAPAPKKKYATKKHTFVDLVSPEGTPGPAVMVAVIVCPVSQIQRVLKELQ